MMRGPQFQNADLSARCSVDNNTNPSNGFAPTCNQCGYDLRFITSMTCPECGRERDHASAVSRHRRLPALLTCTLLLGSLFLIVVQLFTESMMNNELSSAAWMRMERIRQHTFSGTIRTLTWGAAELQFLIGAVCCGLLAWALLIKDDISIGLMIITLLLNFVGLIYGIQLINSITEYATCCTGD
jgi:hypothetical protein